MKPDRISPITLRDRSTRWDLWVRNRLNGPYKAETFQEATKMRAWTIWGKGQKQIKAGRE